MARIDVTPLGGTEYRVEVVEASGTSTHLVIATPSDVERLGGGAPVERLIEESFAFLLEREPKESILGRFDLPVIGRYFPDYATAIRRRLGGSP